MDSVIIFLAEYLLYLMVAGFALAWWVGTDRSGELNPAVSAVLGLILVGVFLYVAGVVLAVAAVLVTASRVAVHAHHVQDVVAGLGLGALAAWLGTLLATMLIARFAVSARLGAEGKRSKDRNNVS